MSALDNLHIATPCPMKFSDMKGDERKRFCTQCRQNVYNLSKLARAEALQVISNSEEFPCVTFYRRADGTVLTSDCNGGFAQAFTEKFSRRKKAGLFALVSAAVVALVFAAAAVYAERVRASQVTGALRGPVEHPSSPNTSLEDFSRNDTPF
jgi:hypothetical protein